MRNQSVPDSWGQPRTLFLCNDKYANSGAQDPEVFQQVFVVAQQDEKDAATQAAAE